MVGGDHPFYLKFWVKLTPLERKRRFSTDIARSASTVTHSEKKFNGRFPCKIALCLKKVCYKVSLCENCQPESCRAFTGLTIRTKMIGRDVPFYVKICQMICLLSLKFVPVLVSWIYAIP